MDEEKIIEEKDENNSNFLIGLWDWIKSFLFAIVLALLIKAFVFEPTQVQGSSMLNTLKTGDRVIVNKIGLKFKPLERGNIIVLHFNPTNEDYIKRVIGLPGDVVQLIDGHFYINGEMLEEAYASTDFTHPINKTEWIIAENEYFVVGDNRAIGASKDSRDFGPVKLEDIKGVASLRFYPFGKSFGWLK